MGPAGLLGLFAVFGANNAYSAGLGSPDVFMTGAISMHPKDIGLSYDAIAHLWHEAPIQSNGLPQLERALRFASQCRSGRSGRFALDIGCGCSGRFIDALARHGFLMEGVDVSERMIELARQSHPHISFHMRIYASGSFRENTILCWPGTASGISRWTGRNLCCGRFARPSLPAECSCSRRRIGQSRRKIGFMHGPAHVLQRIGHPEEPRIAWQPLNKSSLSALLLKSG